MFKKNTYFYLFNLKLDHLATKRLALWIQVFMCFCSYRGQAFVADVIEAKKQIESAVIAAESAVNILDDIEAFEGIESQYIEYEREMREFQRTINKYERLGVDVKDFFEFQEYETNSLKGNIDVIKNYIRRASGLIKTVSSFVKSPESITASEQMETNRVLKVLLQDSQTRELRRLRKEISTQKVLLERKKLEKDFINEQYAYINRHSKGRGFGVFHPFKNNKKQESKKRKKFLGIF